MPLHRGLVARLSRPTKMGRRYRRALTTECYECATISSLRETASVAQSGFVPVLHLSTWQPCRMRALDRDDLQGLNARDR